MDDADAPDSGPHPRDSSDCSLSVPDEPDFDQPERDGSDFEADYEPDQSDFDPPEPDGSDFDSPEPDGSDFDLEFEPEYPDFDGWPKEGTREHADWYVSLVSLGFVSSDPNEAGEDRERAYDLVRATAGKATVRYKDSWQDGYA